MTLGMHDACSIFEESASINWHGKQTLERALQWGFMDGT